MKRNINGFNLTKNGKPITSNIGERKHLEYQGESYKEEGTYYYFNRKFQNYFYYNS